LTNGTSYYATVTVYTTNPNPNDPPISLTGGTITSSSQIPFMVPEAPSVVSTIAGDEEMEVNWSEAMTNGSVFTKYLVELFNADGVLVSSHIVNDKDTTSYTFTGLTNGTRYYARVTVHATDPNNSSVMISGVSTVSDGQPQKLFGVPYVPTLEYYSGYETLRVDWSNVNDNGGSFRKFKVGLYDASGNNLIQPEVEYYDSALRTHTFTGLTIGIYYTVKVNVVTSDPNVGDTIDGPEGSITAAPHDNPIIIGSAMIYNATKTVSVTVDKNGSGITDYMAIIRLNNSVNYMRKINNSTPDPNDDGTFTLSMVFDAFLLDASGNPVYPVLFNPNLPESDKTINSALMVVGNGGGFTAAEFNGRTQTVLSPVHYRDVAQP